jgi:hypothetical protein
MRNLQAHKEQYPKQWSQHLTRAWEVAKNQVKQLEETVVCAEQALIHAQRELSQIRERRERNVKRARTQ